MSFLKELSLYQTKSLRSAGRIVELEKTIADESGADQRLDMQALAAEQAMLRAYEAMISFLNCCIEVQRGDEPSADLPPVKEA